MIRLIFAATLIFLTGMGLSHAQTNTLPAPGYIDTFVGGYLGDNNLATQAALNQPQDVFVDANGNLYIADAEFNRVRKVDTTGIITTIAGGSASSTQPYGDNDLATEAYLREPSAVFVTPSGDLYIADQGLSRIRKVDTSGIITTVAGGGTNPDTTLATEVRLSGPTDIVVDDTGNIYIADRGNHRVRKVDTAGIITTIAGTGERGFSGDDGPATQAQLSNPSGIHLDSAGNLYIADEQNRRVRKVDTTGTITTVAGNGSFASFNEGTPATETGISVKSVFVDVQGLIFISDSFARIRKVDENGNITTFAGGGSNAPTADGLATNAELKSPVGLWGDSAGNLYIAERDANLIRKVDTNNNISTVAGGYIGDGQFRTLAALVQPKGLTLDHSGNLFVADYDHNRVRKIDITTGLIETVVGNGAGGSIGENISALEATFSLPVGITFDQQGNLYTSTQAWSSIHKKDASGILTTFAGSGNETTDGITATDARLSSPNDLVFDANGNLYIANLNNHTLKKVDPSGIITTIAGNGQFGFSGDDGPATNAQLNRPSGLTFDTSGNLYIADTGNKRIRKIDTSGIITTIAGGGSAGFPTYGHDGPATDAQLIDPTDVAIDTSGILYIADQRLIRKVDPNGIITNLAGDGITRASTGDGGLATDAKISSAFSLIVTPDGYLYFSDDANHTVRVINLNIPEATTPTPDFNGNGTVDFPDFIAFASAFGTRTDQTNFDAKFDLDSNGDIGFSDFLIFATAFGTSP